MLISSVLQILDHGSTQNRLFLEKAKTGSDAASKAEATEQAASNSRQLSAQALPAAPAGEPPSVFRTDADPVQTFQQGIRDFRRAVDEASKPPLAAKLDFFE